MDRGRLSPAAGVSPQGGNNARFISGAGRLGDSGDLKAKGQKVLCNEIYSTYQSVNLVVLI